MRGQIMYQTCVKYLVYKVLPSFIRVKMNPYCLRYPRIGTFKDLDNLWTCKGLHIGFNICEKEVKYHIFRKLFIFNAHRFKSITLSFLCVIAIRYLIILVFFKTCKCIANRFSPCAVGIFLRMDSQLLSHYLKKKSLPKVRWYPVLILL